MSLEFIEINQMTNIWKQAQNSFSIERFIYRWQWILNTLRFI